MHTPNPKTILHYVQSEIPFSFTNVKKKEEEEEESIPSRKKSNTFATKHWRKIKCIYGFTANVNYVQILSRDE